MGLLDKAPLNLAFVCLEALLPGCPPEVKQPVDKSTHPSTVAKPPIRRDLVKHT